MTKKVVLITGASSGIGLACAEDLSTLGHTAVGASRRPSAGHAWTSLEMDVDDDLSVSAGIERTITEYGGIDAIVTCAGWGLAGAIEQTSINEAKAQMETNFFWNSSSRGGCPPFAQRAPGQRHHHELDRRDHWNPIPGLLLSEQVCPRRLG